MKISIGILAGQACGGLNGARVKTYNRNVIKKLTAELSPVGEILISAARKTDYQDLAEKTMEDSSPLEGIYNVVSRADTDWIFVCGADMPNVSAGLIRYMTGYISSDCDCVCLADENHVQPLCAIYSKALLPLIKEALGRRDFRLAALLTRARTKYIDLKYTVFDKSVVKNGYTRKPEPALRPSAVFCVCGFSDTGKTGLIVKLINEFIGEGYSVGAIKHDGHDCFSETKGTDSVMFADAGASAWAVFSEKRFSVSCREKAEPEEMLKLLRITGGVDVVIFEGLKSSDFPKIEITKKGLPPVTDPDMLICKVTDEKSPENEDVPVFCRDDAEGIFSCVKKYFGLREPENEET